MDRDEIKRRMQQAVREGDPEFEHADSIYACDVLTILAELEQAARERDEGWLAYHEKREELVARLAKVPALVEALTEIRRIGTLVTADGDTRVVYDYAAIAREALAAWESD